MKNLDHLLPSSSLEHHAFLDRRTPAMHGGVPLHELALGGCRGAEYPRPVARNNGVLCIHPYSASIGPSVLAPQKEEQAV